MPISMGKSTQLIHLRSVKDKQESLTATIKTTALPSGVISACAFRVLNKIDILYSFFANVWISVV